LRKGKTSVLLKERRFCYDAGMDFLLTFVEKIPFLQILIGIAFIFYWIRVFFIVYHLTRFGVGPAPKLMALIFFVGAAFLVGIAFITFSRIDFHQITENLRANIERYVPQAPDEITPQ
jgi:hypothetical protein